MVTLTPTFRYWNEVTGVVGTPPGVPNWETNEVTGMGISWPSRSSAGWPSLARSFGAASSRASLLLLKSRKVAELGKIR